MFGIGGQELVLLMLIGLVVLGPERLPRLANQLGSWLGQARRMTRVMKRQLEEELELNKPHNVAPPRTLRDPSMQRPPDPDAQTPREDDDYSAAHGADEAGTGVGEDIYDDDTDLAVTEAERSSDSEAPAAEPDGDDKKEAS